MARIELRGVAHSYSAPSDGTREWAVEPMDLVWDDGGAYALLGPSGCGKTTLLNIVSGLVRPTRGAVHFDGADRTDLPTEARNIAQVFQFPVVYDTMTVFENLAFPLKNRGIFGAAARTRIEEVAEILELTASLGQGVRDLPADARQRICLGRGLVRTDVAALLLDEPLAAVDPHLRWRLGRKLRQAHRRLGVTMVYVTHDQTEASTLADRVIVMNRGRVVQQGTPEDLFERPADVFVGHFVGSPGMNVLPCRVENAAVVVGGEAVPFPADVCARARGAGGEMALGIRPEFVRRSEASVTSAFRTTVVSIDELGHRRIATAVLGSETLRFDLDDGDAVAPKDECWIEFPEGRAFLYSNGRVVS